MPEPGRFSRELRARLWKPQVNDEVSDEIRSHLEQMEQDLVSRGMPAEEARREARRRFGDLARIEQQCRDLGERRDTEFRWRRWRDEIRQDVRQALRQLRFSPRFALVAICTLAVGLGASSTIFGIASAVLLRPLPYADPDRLLLVSEVTPDGVPFSVSEPNYLDLAARSRSFVSLAALSGLLASLTGDGEPEQVRGAAVTHTFFPTLGVVPVRGRGFLAAEDAAGGDTLVAVISDRLWERRYGLDPQILGRRVDINGAAHRVVGVIPATSAFPADVDVWTPLSPALDFPRADRRLEMFGRLRDDATPAQARAELAGIMRELERTYPLANDKWTTTVAPFKEWFVSPQLEARVIALLATVVLLLVMACINVANLLLSRAAVREREVAMRAALGAGGGRIVRQLLTESLVLSAAGATLGTLLAYAAVPVIKSVAGESVQRLQTLSVDWRVLAFSVVACIVTGVVFGLAPALRFVRTLGASRVSSFDVLRSGSRLAPPGRTRNALIVASVALATVLLVSASLVGRSFLKLMGSELGFSPEGVLIANVSIANERYDAPRSVEFVRTLIAQVSSSPGVEAVGAINIPPFGRGNFSQGFIRGERANERREGYRLGSWRVVTPGYFESLQIPLKRGRTFTSEDRAGSDVVVVINETLARQAFGEEDPIGQRLASSNGQVKTVVGVVGDTRHLYLDSLPNATMYWAHAQLPARSMWLTARTAGDANALAATVRAQVRALDQLLPVSGVRGLGELVASRSAQARLTMLVFGIFATAALVLAAIGLYGVIAYSVAQRTREIGVTLALGARPASIVRRILRDGLTLSALGIAIGAAGAVGVGTLLRTILYETTPTDGATYGLVAALLLVVSIIASVAPARRASRLDPVEALRAE